MVDSATTGLAGLEAVVELPQSRQTPLAGVVVCHPHPLYGGDMHNYVVTALCRRLVQQGIAALRFNFRGVGRSSGRYDEGSGELEDAERALGYFASRPEIDATRVAIAGYSFGGWIASGAGQPAQVCLSISPPEIMAGKLPLLAITGELDDIAQPGLLRTDIEARGGELEVIAGADHFWGQGLEAAVERGVAFLDQKLRG